MSTRGRRIRNSNEDIEEERGPRRGTRRGTQPSGNNSGPKRRRGEEGEEEEEEEEESSADDSSNEGSGIQSSFAEKSAQKMSKEEFERKVKEVVRLALASELRKVPLKREEIAKKVLMEHSRAFPVILSKAQERIRDIFGMDLVEMPAKDKRVNIGLGAPRRNAQSKEKSSSKSYMLQNILPRELLETDLINWDKNKDLEVMGLLTVVLSLIHVNGRVLSDDQLDNYFKRLHLDNKEKFDLEKLLGNFVKQGYLDKQKASIVENSSQTSEKDPVEYRWGPRAKIEMPESNLCDFIKAVYGNDAPHELEKRIERASGIDIANINL